MKNHYQKTYKNYITQKVKNFKISDLMISIEPSNICNAECIMCPYREMTRKKEIMPMGFFKKIVNKCLMYGVRNFNLNFYNEPFLDPFIFKRIKYLKSKRVKVQLFSNGSVLNNKTIEKILKSKLDEIIFSIDAAKEKTYELIRKGLVFKKIVNNILSLIKRKEDLGLEKPKIKLNFVKQKLNKDELKEFRLFWANKVNKIYFVLDDGRNEISKNLKIKKSLTNFPCLRLWSELIVMNNGKVPLCCVDYDGKIILGDFNTQDLKEIWDSKKFKRIRQIHVNFEANKIFPCKKCINSYRTKTK